MLIIFWFSHVDHFLMLIIFCTPHNINTFQNSSWRISQIFQMLKNDSDDHWFHNACGRNISETTSDKRRTSGTFFLQLFSYVVSPFVNSSSLTFVASLASVFFSWWFSTLMRFIRELFGVWCKQQVVRVSKKSGNCFVASSSYTENGGLSI